MAIEYEIIEQATRVIEQFNQASTEAVSDMARAAMERSLQETGNIQFLQFTCPPINARLLAAGDPKYILTEPVGNNFEKGGKDARLNKFLKELELSGVPNQLEIIIGDTDELTYIFPVLGLPETLSDAECSFRKDTYAKSFTQRIKEKYPRWNFTVTRMSEVASLFDCQDLPAVPDLSSLEEEVLQEARQMRYSFGTKGYYEGYPLPKDVLLQKIALLKFKTYGIQGYMLKSLYPNAILIQNEFPLMLRTRMINIINTRLKQPLPVIYPYQQR